LRWKNGFDFMIMSYAMLTSVEGIDIDVDLPVSVNI